MRIFWRLEFRSPGIQGIVRKSILPHSSTFHTTSPYRGPCLRDALSCWETSQNLQSGIHRPLFLRPAIVEHNIVVTQVAQA
jgi:hypothetical protein